MDPPQLCPPASAHTLTADCAATSVEMVEIGCRRAASGPRSHGHAADPQEIGITRSPDCIRSAFRGRAPEILADMGGLQSAAAQTLEMSVRSVLIQARPRSSMAWQRGAYQPKTL